MRYLLLIILFQFAAHSSLSSMGGAPCESGASGSCGQYNTSATINSCNNCNINVGTDSGSLGGSASGLTVTAQSCGAITLFLTYSFDWHTGANDNWIHGVTVTNASDWDSFDQSPPAGWIYSTGVTGDCSGQSYGAGFYYDGTGNSSNPLGVIESAGMGCNNCLYPNIAGCNFVCDGTLSTSELGPSNGPSACCVGTTISVSGTVTLSYPPSNDGNPGNNWGICCTTDCPTFNFELTFCPTNTNPQTLTKSFTMATSPDGNSGAWCNPATCDENNNFDVTIIGACGPDADFNEPPDNFCNAPVFNLGNGSAGYDGGAEWIGSTVTSPGIANATFSYCTNINNTSITHVVGENGCNAPPVSYTYMVYKPLIQPPTATNPTGCGAFNPGLTVSVLYNDGSGPLENWMTNNSNPGTIVWQSNTPGVPNYTPGSTVSAPGCVPLTISYTPMLNTGCAACDVVGTPISITAYPQLEEIITNNPATCGTATVTIRNVATGTICYTNSVSCPNPGNGPTSVNYNQSYNAGSPCPYNFMGTLSCNCAGCLAEAGTVSASPTPTCPGSNITANVSGNYTGAGYTTVFLFVNSSGTVISQNSTGIFTAPATCGSYSIYTYNYQNPPAGTAPTMPSNISSISCQSPPNNHCCDLSSPFAITIGVSLILNCPTPGNTSACQTQAAVNTAYLTWLSGATASGGCAPINLSNNNPGAPSNCGGSTTVTWTATDACNVPTTCSSTFTVASPPALIINCPTPGSTGSCQTQAAVNTAFTTWLSTVSASGGCGTISYSNNNTGAPPACGGSVTVTFTATDACSQTQTCNAIFTVASPPALIINCPAPGSTASCQTQAAVNTAFTTWLSTVSASGGCGTISYSNNNTGAPPACGGNVTVTFTATDACSQTQTCSAIFTVASPPALIINCPSPGNTAFCQTQAAVNSAYASWLSTATASGGCGSLSISNNSTGAPPACGGTVTVSFSVMDACAQTQTCSANFTVAADNTPPVFTNPSDQTVSCISAIPATESLSYTDNCSPPGSVSLFVDGPPINICTGGSMTRTWTVNDACGNPATENKVYTILAPTPTACDDGNPCTINDMHTLGCDGITICVACAGTPTTPTTPTFSPIGPLCQGATAPALPTMSNNGISGTWNPSNIDTSIPNSTTYTFTPSGPGCYLPATLVIVVNAGPTLTVTESCSGGLGTGIINSTGTAGSEGSLTYTINGAPDPDGDATMLSNGTYTIVVTESPSGCTSSQTITINCACPTIVLNGPTTICQSAPPVTFTQAGGAGAGTWTVSPSGAGTINSSTGVFDPNNTYSGGVTITYTEGACSEVINVMITQTITPTFTNPGPICQSAGIITLPTSSTNSPPITGTWVPSTVDPSSGNDVTATFTPDANQCAEIVMMTIDVLPSPTIMVDVSCVGGPGTGVINTTATAGSGGVLTYTINGTLDGDGDQNMLPNGAYTVVVTETPGGCTSSQTVNVNCTCPTINISGPLQVCQTATATFTQSGGNSGGTWSISPSGAGTIDNTGFFNPTDTYNGPVNIIYTADGCVGQTQIFVIELITPIFSNPGPLCQSNAPMTLPTSSNNTPPITGVWVPATIDPSAGTNVTASFNPDPNQCAAPFTMVIVINPNPTANISGDDQICSGDNVTLNATGGSGYVWSNGGGTNPSATFNNVTSTTTYSVVVTDATGCTDDATFTVNVTPMPTLVIGNVMCSADLLTYSVDFTATGGTVTTSAGTVGGTSVTGIPIGTSPVIITVTSTSNSECTVSIPVVAPDCSCPTIPPPTGNSEEICQGEPIPNLIVNVGTGYTARWYNTASGGAPIFSGNSFTPPSGGTWYVETYDPVTNCVSSTRLTISLTIHPNPTANISGDNQICSGEDITLNATGGSGYVWSNGGGTNPTATFNNVTSTTTYSVVVTDANGCTDDATFTVNVTPMPTLVIGNVMCSADLLTYSVDFTATGGTVTASGGTVGATSVTGIPIGTSPVTITVTSTLDGSCTISIPVVAPDCSCPTIPPPTGNSEEICQGEPIPNLIVNVGTGYTARWYNTASGGAPIFSGNSFTPPSGGTWYVETYDPVTNCVSSTRLTISLTIHPNPTANISGDNQICSGEDVTLNATGGSGYVWSNGGGTNPTATFNNVTSTTTYSVVVTDANGCTDDATFTVNVTPMPTLVIGNVMCSADLLTYSVDFTATGGTVTASAGTVGATSVTGIPIGTSPVIITVTSPTNSDCTLSISVVAPDCSCPTIPPPTGNSEEICQGEPIPNLIVNVGTGYTARWYNVASGGAPIFSGSSFMPPSGGTWYVETYDPVTNCVSSTRLTISLTIHTNPTANISGDNQICSGEDVTLNATGGSGYVWSNGGGTNPTATFNNVTSTTTYSVVVTDANGCTDDATFTVNVTPMPTLVIGNVMCSADLLTYSVDFTATGGTVTASAGTVGATSVTGIPIGTSPVIITVTSTSNSECTISIPVVAPDCSCPTIPPPTGNSEEICQGEPIPNLIVNVGTGYTASWYNVASGGAPIFSGSSFTPPSGGTWYVETYDPVTNCVSSTRLTISLTIQPTPTANISGDNQICSGEDVTLNATGGSGYVWSNGGGTNPSATFNNVTSTTTYSVVVTDANGCTDDATFTVNVTPMPTLVIGNVMCSADLLTYSVDFTATGGTVTASAGTVGATSVTGLPIGTSPVTITVTSTLDGSCTVSIPVVAPDCSCPTIPPPTGNSEEICQGEPIPNLIVNVGTGYTARWYNVSSGGAPIFSGSSFTPPSGGTWYVETYDPVTNCVSSTRLTISLTIQPTPTANISGDNQICSGEDVTLNATGGSGYVWSNGGGTNPTATFNNVTSTTTYSVVVTDANGCTDDATFTVNVTPMPTLLIADVQCNTSLTTYQIVTAYSNGNLGSNFGTINGNIIENIDINIDPVIVTVTSPNGLCVESITVNAPDCSCGNINVPIGNNVEICLGEPIPPLQVTVGAGLEAHWYNVANGGSPIFVGLNYTPATAGTWYVEAVDPITNCTSNTRLIIRLTIHPVPTANITGNNSICEGDNVTLFASGGMSFDWSNNGGSNSSATFQNVVATTTYVVTVTNSFGCQDTDDFTVTVNEQPSLDIISVDCSVDNQTYTVDVSFTGGTLTSSAGVVIGNSIQNIPINVSPVIITVTNPSNPACAESISVAAPDCNCPTIPVPTGQSKTICAGTPIPSLTISLQAGLQANWYNQPSGGTPFLTNSTTYTPLTSGTWYIESVDPATGCTSSLRLPISLIINPLPVVGISGLTKVCAGSDVTLSASGGGTYLWSNGGTNSAITLTSVSTSTTIQCIVTNINGCSASASHTLNVTPLPTLTIDNVACDASLQFYSITVAFSGGTLSASAGTVNGNIIQNIPINNGITITVTNAQNNSCSVSQQIQPPNCDCQSIAAPVGSDVVICAGDPITPLSVTVAAGLQVNWFLSSIGGSPVQTNSLTYLPSGVGTYYAEAFDPVTNCKSLVRTPIKLTIQAKPNAGLDAQKSLCNASGGSNPTSIDLKTLVSVTGGSFTPQGSAPVLTGTTFNAVGVVAGSYSYQYIVAGVPPCPDDIAVITIVVTDCSNPCTISVTNLQTSACNNNNTTTNNGDDYFGCTFVVSGTGNSSQFSVFLNGVSLGNFNYNSVTNINNLPANGQNLVLTITDLSNPACTTTVNVTSQPCSTCFIDAKVYAVDTLTCKLTDVTLSGSIVGSTAGLQFVWTDNTGKVIGNGINTIVNAPGIYYFQAINTVDGCQSSKIPVTVIQDIAKPIAIIKADPLNAISCSVKFVTLSHNDPEPNVDYSWKFNNVVSIEGQIQVTEQGQAILIAIDTLNGCFNTDSLSIIEAIEYPIIQIEHPDIIDCQNNGIILNATGSQSGSTIVYQWFDQNNNAITGAVGQTLTVSNPGIYYLRLEDTATGCVNIDTIVVEASINVPLANAGLNQTLPCNNNGLLLNSTGSSTGTNVNYSWTVNGTVISNNGSTQVSSPGSYVLQVTNTSNNCVRTDTVLITAPLPIGFGVSIDSTTCFEVKDGSIICTDFVNAVPPLSINLQPGNITNSQGIFTNLSGGAYNIQVTDANGCTSSTLANVYQPAKISLVIEGIDSLKLGEVTTLEVLLNLPPGSIRSVSWTPTTDLSCPTCLETDASPETSTTYTVDVIDENGCSARAKITVFVDRNVTITVPNIISTEGNGSNGKFTIYTKDPDLVLIDNFSVFDRWGNLVYNAKNVKPNDPEIGWDGTFNNADVVDGVYVYLIEVTIRGDERVVLKGDITKIR